MPAIKPVSSKPQETPHKHPHNEKKYKDPLNSWTLKALSFTNEIGTGLNEIAPKVTFALWIPTFMYLGADIYDKYKNDQNEYCPSRKRGVKQAIGQGLTSFILPAGAILLGQKLTSPIGKLISDNLSLNAREEVYNHTKNVIDQAIGEHFDDKTKFKKFLSETLTNRTNALKNTKQTDNIFKKAYRYLTGYFALADSDPDKLAYFAGKNADRIFEIKELLEKDVPNEKIPKKIYKKYHETKPIMQKTYGDDFAHHALKTALKEYQNKQIVRNKLVKTFGGLVSLVLLIKPINMFVDKVLMPKYIAPSINKIDKKLMEGNHLRLHVRHLDDYGTKPTKLPSDENEKKPSEAPSKTESAPSQSEALQKDPEHNAHPEKSQPHSSQEQKSLKEQAPSQT